MSSEQKLVDNLVNASQTQVFQKVQERTGVLREKLVTSGLFIAIHGLTTVALSGDERVANVIRVINGSVLGLVAGDVDVKAIDKFTNGLQGFEIGVGLAMIGTGLYVHRKIEDIVKIDTK